MDSRVGKREADHDDDDVSAVSAGEEQGGGMAAYGSIKEWNPRP